MNKVIKLLLARPAKKSGGDRYEADVNEPNPWVVYIPQKLSRPEGKLAEEILITLEIEK